MNVNLQYESSWSRVDVNLLLQALISNQQTDHNCFVGREIFTTLNKISFNQSYSILGLTNREKVWEITGEGE